MASELPITLISTLITYYREHPTFNVSDRFADRIAVREHYSDGWVAGMPGLAIKPDGGLPDKYTLQASGRVECSIYASDVETCDVLFALMERDAQQFERTVVANESVLQSLVFETGPTYIHDPDTNLPTYIFFINATVRTESVLTV